MAQKAEGAGILERGNIYFLYRPKVQQERARKKADVERFYMVLSPAGRKLFREIVIGQKELPKVARRERNWGFVKMVVQDGSRAGRWCRASRRCTSLRSGILPAQPKECTDCRDCEYSRSRHE